MTHGSNVIIRHLRDDGTTSGAVDMNVDGSSTPVPYWFPVPTGKIALIRKMIVQVGDTGPLDADDFGGLAALTNGIHIKVLDSGDNTVLDLLDGGSINSNSEWAEYLYDTRIDGYGAGDDFVSMEWDFSDFLDGGLHLHEGEKLVLTVRDNLTTLSNFEAIVKGEWIE